MATRPLLLFLVGMMLLTGVCNTLLTKYQDLQCVENCDSPDPRRRRHFEQPIWQTVQMFVGESGCWLVLGASSLYKAIRSRVSDRSARGEYAPLFADNEADDEILAPTEPQPGAESSEMQPLQGWRLIILALPAVFDIIGTTLMNAGLLFVAASIYQMTRGALVLFAGIASIIFLKRHIPLGKWAALFIVVLGVAIVGLAGIVQPDRRHEGGPSSTVYGDDADSAMATARLVARALVGRAEDIQAVKTSPLLTFVGLLMVGIAQIFAAGQFVSEESIMHRYSISPLALVSWEGIFGFVITVSVQFIAHFAYGRTERGRGSYFDASTGWHDMTHNRTVAVTSLLIMLSIGGFNFFGLSVTRAVSATSRSTIDTCRTLFIWLVSLGLGWESFKSLQVLGFACLVYGTFLFNDIVRPPRFGRWTRADRGAAVVEQPLEHS